MSLGSMEKWGGLTSAAQAFFTKEFQVLGSSILDRNGKPFLGSHFNKETERRMRFGYWKHMKKTFQIQVPNKKPERQLDSIRHEIKKYLGRERRKPFIEGADGWDFHCRIGPDEESAVSVKVPEISKKITEISQKDIKSFYVEILAKPGYKPKK